MNIDWCKQQTEELQQQIERQKQVGGIIHRIHAGQDLAAILQSAVTEIRQLLDLDRALVFCFEPDWSGRTIAESAKSSARHILGEAIVDPCFTARQIERYARGAYQAIEDTRAGNLAPCYANLLISFDVRANLVVPIVHYQELWGLLIAQQCQTPRTWQPSEIAILQELAAHLGMALLQTELQEQFRRLNLYLEEQVQERTERLRQSMNYEALVRRITEKVRDSLDEHQILRTAAQELGQELQLDRCQIELYDVSQETATVVCEFTNFMPSCEGLSRRIAEFPELYEQLLQRQPMQFAELIPHWNPVPVCVTRLGCPIFDDRGLLGNIWGIRPQSETFRDLEVSLVQQIANECAIAIRQARLYETACAQVKELERLNHLKDDFLKTITHELRTPLTGIILAAQTLEKTIELESKAKQPNVQRLLHILNSECERESQLIGDLLSLTYLEAGTEVLNPEILNLEEWLRYITASFRQRIHHAQQSLEVNIPGDLPLLDTDVAYLERIVLELLDNACKYTPPGEHITVTARGTGDRAQIEVGNSGVEIAPEELPRVFDKFYRIPKYDPWQYGGTGLGLALAQKMAHRLGASLRVRSDRGWTFFTLELPIAGE